MKRLNPSNTEQKRCSLSMTKDLAMTGGTNQQRYIHSSEQTCHFLPPSPITRSMRRKQHGRPIIDALTQSSSSSCSMQSTGAPPQGEWRRPENSASGVSGAAGGNGGRHLGIFAPSPSIKRTPTTCIVCGKEDGFENTQTK